MTFTIKTPQKDAQGNYVYDSNGNQQFTTRSDGPYSGSGSATLNVKDGKFKVFIKPDDNFPQYNGDQNGYRNQLGVGEIANIIVVKEYGETEEVTFSKAKYKTDNPPTNPKVNLSGNGPKITAGDTNGSEAFRVWAKDSLGKEIGPETIGATVLEPTGVSFFPTPGGNIAHVQGAPSIGLILEWQVLPTTVSFCNITSNCLF